MFAVVALAIGCSPRSTKDHRPATEAERGRFPHADHQEIACVECHDLAGVLAGEPSRPGQADHAPCDRAQCHQAEFLARPGPLCEQCHTAFDAGTLVGSELVPYPPTTGRRALAATFSHKSHLDFARMEDRVGFHISCTDCHAERGDPLASPDHAVCIRCHAPETQIPGAPSMIECDRCHRPRDQQPSRSRQVIIGDLRFDHATHRSDRRGARISCAECHTDAAYATSIGSHALPTASTCVACHDDNARTPPSMRMRVCETCHATERASFGSIAPRSHLPALERPQDHTGAFRRDHAADAEANPSRCATCHTFMSGSARDTCDDCHRTMRPQSHTVTWREFDHGPASMVTTDGCATCHQADLCTACHQNVRPRSHFPALAFANGGHGSLARVNLRSCTTCHVPDQMCANCHAPGGP